MDLVKRPNKIDLIKLNKNFDVDKKTNYTETALIKLFASTYPLNINLDEIVIKVSALDNLYSTQLRMSGGCVQMSHHIKALNIDHRLQSGDLSLVDDIANITLPDGKSSRLYSFASKYCSFHRPEVFSIYDSYVDGVLKHFNKIDGFYGKGMNNKDYLKYIDAINSFITFYELEEHSLKEVDKYLWQLGYDLIKYKKESTS